MKVDESGWDQPNMFKRGKGRPRSTDPLIFKTVGLTAEQWSWLAKWSSGSPTSALRELFERALKFWPAGPGRFR